MIRFHSLFTLLLLAVLSGTIISCTYSTMPMSSSSGQSHDGRTPKMLKAQTVAPEFVTPPAEQNLDTPSTPTTPPAHESVASVNDNPANNDDKDDDGVDPLPSTVVSTGSSREQEHISMTSYNPFESSDVFMVDLASEAENFHYPIDGHLLSPFGQRGRGWHSGSDIKGEHGDPIYAVFDGEVRMSRNYAGYGNVVVIRHRNGLETAYSHNSSNIVKVGDRVKSGQKIALCGRTGRATGTHCHFEVRVLGQAINPALLLDFNRRTIQTGTIVVSKNANNKVLAKRTGEGSPQESISRPSAPKDYIASNSATNTNSDNATTIITASSATNSSSKTTTNTSHNSGDNTTSGAAKYHTVAKGDTLYALALKYKTTVKKICALNNINEKNYLQLKQKLRVL